MAWSESQCMGMATFVVVVVVFSRQPAFTFPTHFENTLRQALCDHLMQHVLFYLGFFSNSHSTHLARRVITCMAGVWNTTANDVIPLALANFTGRRVNIFTSKKQLPVVGITPSMSGVTCSVFSANLHGIAGCNRNARTL